MFSPRMITFIDHCSSGVRPCACGFEAGISHGFLAKSGIFYKRDSLRIYNSRPHAVRSVIEKHMFLGSTTSDNCLSVVQKINGFWIERQLYQKGSEQKNTSGSMLDRSIECRAF